MTDEAIELGEEKAEADNLERLRQESEETSRRLQARDARIKEMEEELAAREAGIASLQEAIQKLEGKLTEGGEALAGAVAAYRELAVAAHPEIPPELVTGETIEAVDASLENARALIGRVKQGLEAEAPRARVPAGAPQRASFDLSALSPREKIQYAIGGRR